MEGSKTLGSILEKHCKVFEEGLGTLKNFKVKIIVDSDATPKFLQSQIPPLCISTQSRNGVRTVGDIGNHSTYPVCRMVVCVVKKDDSKRLRICGDFKCTVNSASTEVRQVSHSKN